PRPGETPAAAYLWAVCQRHPYPGAADCHGCGSGGRAGYHRSVPGGDRLRDVVGGAYAGVEMELDTPGAGGCVDGSGLVCGGWSVGVEVELDTPRGGTR